MRTLGSSAAVACQLPGCSARRPLLNLTKLTNSEEASAIDAIGVPTTQQKRQQMILQQLCPIKNDSKHGGAGEGRPTILTIFYLLVESS